MEVTIGEINKKVESASTDFEKKNSDLKRRYLIWNIEAFNSLAKSVSVSRGSFGTGYPFYVLDKNLNGELPIIPEQLRYNRQLLEDARTIQQIAWECASCLKRNYSQMPDLKQICKPCPNVSNALKPRKLINRLPDLDMWLICEDGCVEIAQQELEILLAQNSMRTSDVDPLASIDDVSQIAQKIKSGEMPAIFLPMDVHIMEYSAIMDLINKVPDKLNYAKQKNVKPYLPILPKSYRKTWQYDDEAYNFVYDYLSAFTTFNIPEELQECLDKSRARVVLEHEPEELFEFLMHAATEANARRLHTPELEKCFLNRVKDWKSCNRTTSFDVDIDR